jgi:acyl carrier protein
MQRVNLLDIEERIKHVLISKLRVGSAILAESNSTTPLLGHGVGLDSIETLTLVAAIEEEYNIEIDDSDLTVDLFKNFSTLAQYILERATY